MHKTDVIIIGGGFYGCCLALFLRGYYDDVTILEKEDDLLKRASSINQARVHTGYHYPRSLVTAYRSLVNFPKFVLDFRKAVVGDFTKVYAIARKGSKVNAHRFYNMFRQMKAKISVAPPEIQSFFNMEYIEGIFLVEEQVFNVDILRNILRKKIEHANVTVLCGKEVEKVERAEHGRIRVHILENEYSYDAELVFNCAYSQINNLLKKSGIALLPFKHELTEMALIEVPEELNNFGITVMDGPFFSIIPYPSRQLYSLSHVRYTPHLHWNDTDTLVDGHKYLEENQMASNYVYMIRDAQRYIPAIRRANYVESLYEIKTVLTKNEQDDGRPILFKQNHGIQNFTCIMGGKIDNIYDVLETIDEAKRSLGLKRNVWRFLFPDRSPKSTMCAI